MNINWDTYPKSSWLKNFDDYICLNKITIPGTHESCSSKNRLKINMFNCQIGDISSQLEAGIRYLDLRCHLDKGIIGLSHGGADMYAKLDKVLEDCYNFLLKNQSEFIFIKIKKEKNKLTKIGGKMGLGTLDTSNSKFDAAFQNCIKKFKSIFYLKNEIPFLKDVRGKIILIYDKGIESKIGLDWSSKELFNKQGEWNFQNYLSITDSQQTKLKLVIEHFKKAKDSTNSAIYVNALNASGSLDLRKTPESFADYLNPKVADYLDKNPQGYYGIINIDFALKDHGIKLINKIIRANNFLLSGSLKRRNAVKRISSRNTAG
ncbi:phosphatidylinositol-specific phospholipase C domain-containing protein [Pigmentibacter ruber]|nr:phosphatidylinositol-specific phospholipase C [Pigmentibacter ruber]